MSDIRLVNVVPIVNGWNDAAKKNLEEAKTLMASGNHLDYNAGVVKESVANLVSGFADDLMKAPAVDPESRRPVYLIGFCNAVSRIAKDAAKGTELRMEERTS